MKKSLWFYLAALTLPWISLAAPPCLPENHPQEVTEPEVLKLFKKVTEILGVIGEAVPEVAETCDATKFVYELVNKDVDEIYKKGDPNAVWTKNAGIMHHFNHLQELSPSFETHADSFTQTIKALDQINPIIGKKPLLGDTASYNAYKIALSETDGNVFKAATLLGKIGHDDAYSPVRIESRLFARQSLGKTVDIPPAVLKNYEEATRECFEFHEIPFVEKDLPYLEPTSLSNSCDGAGAANNYHLIAGFYLGCQLAKKGFQKVDLPKPLVDLVSKETRHESLASQWQTKKGLLMDKTCLNLCTDIPASSSYCYKQLTLPRFISEDAKILFNAGYTRPFQHKEKSFAKLKAAPPVNAWEVSRLKKALGNLDLRLMNVEYTYAQHKAGAEFGSKVCGDYKISIKPDALKKPKTKIAKDASKLYELGYFSQHVNPSDLTRSAVKRWTPDRKQKALDFLKAELRKIPTQMDFGEEPQGLELPQDLGQSKVHEKMGD